MTMRQLWRSLTWRRATPTTPPTSLEWAPPPDWKNWRYTRPPNDALLEVRRPEWAKSSICMASHINPEMDVLRLYWRLADSEAIEARALIVIREGIARAAAGLAEEDLG